MTDQEKRELCAAVTRKLLDRIGPDLKWLADNGIGVTIYAGTLGDGGAMAYISTIEREDMLKTLEEWLAYQRAGMSSEPIGERGRG